MDEQLSQIIEELPVTVGLAHGGRGLFAKKDFAEGDLIFTEPVFASQVKNFIGTANHPVPYSMCSHCMRYLGPIEKQLGLVCEYIGKKMPSDVC